MKNLSLYIHSIAGCVLLVSHALFFFRALAMRRKGTGPERIDRIARSISHWGLPLVAAVGIAAMGQSNGSSESTVRIVHILLGFSPVLAIMIFTVMRPVKIRVPWLLPLINLVLFVLATLSGFLAGTGI